MQTEGTHLKVGGGEVKSYTRMCRLTDLKGGVQHVEVNFSNTAIYSDKQTDMMQAFSLFGDARFLYTLYLPSFLPSLASIHHSSFILHSSCLRNSCVLKYSGMGSSYLAITL